MFQNTFYYSRQHVHMVLLTLFNFNNSSKPFPCIDIYIYLKTTLSITEWLLLIKAHPCGLRNYMYQSFGVAVAVRGLKSADTSIDQRLSVLCSLI